MKRQRMNQITDHKVRLEWCMHTRLMLFILRRAHLKISAENAGALALLRVENKHFAL